MSRILIFLVVTILSQALSQTTSPPPPAQNSNFVQKQRHELKGLKVTPSSQNEIQGLRTFIRAESSKQYFYRGGEIREGQPLEVLVPKEMESQFTNSIHAISQDMNIEVSQDRIKMKTYKQQLGHTLQQAATGGCYNGYCWKWCNGYGNNWCYMSRYYPGIQTNPIRLTCWYDSDCTDVNNWQCYRPCGGPAE